MTESGGVGRNRLFAFVMTESARTHTVTVVIIGSGVVKTCL